MVFYLAVFLQAGAYGLTFMLPRLFEGLGANEKVVGTMLMFTAISTLCSVYYCGHLSDVFGKVKMLAIGCLAIALTLTFYGNATAVGGLMLAASLLLGFGWDTTYALCPIVLTELVADEFRVRFFTLLSVAVMAGFGLSLVLAAFLEVAGQTVVAAFMLTSALCFFCGDNVFLPCETD